MPCNTYLEWLDTPGAESGSLPEHLSRHLSGCADCRLARGKIQALRSHCAKMSPDANEAKRLWESLAPLIPAQPPSHPAQPAGNTPSGSAHTAGKASTGVSLQTGFGPIVILATATILIGVIEYGLTSRHPKTPVTTAPSAIQSEPSASPNDSTASVSAPASPPSAVLPAPAPVLPGVSTPPMPSTPPSHQMPDTPDFSGSSVQTDVRPPESRTTSSPSGQEEALTDGFVPLSEPASGKD